MTKHGAFGPTGCARREDDVGGVVSSKGRAAACHLLDMYVAGAGRKLSDGRALGPCRSVQYHDLLERFESRLVGKQVHQVGAEHVRHGEEQAGSRGSQDMTSLLSAVSSVQGHQDRADGIDGEACDHPFRGVGGPQGHAISRLDPTAHQSARHPVHSFGQLAKRKTVGPIDQGFVVSVILCGLIQRFGDCPRLPITQPVYVPVVRHECIYYENGGA